MAELLSTHLHPGCGRCLGIFRIELHDWPLRPFSPFFPLRPAPILQQVSAPMEEGKLMKQWGRTVLCVLSELTNRIVWAPSLQVNWCFRLTRHPGFARLLVELLLPSSVILWLHSMSVLVGVECVVGSSTLLLLKAALFLSDTMTDGGVLVIPGISSSVRLLTLPEKHRDVPGLRALSLRSSLASISTESKDAGVCSLLRR